MATLRVRDACPDDGVFLAEAQLAMARETESKELDADCLKAGVRAVFDDPSKGSYLVAENEGRSEPVGCLLLTVEWSEWRGGWFWWIQSVYTRPEQRERGVYRALWEEVLRRAAARSDVRGVRLYVERDNRSARAVYETLGMHETSYRLYEYELEGDGKEE